MRCRRCDTNVAAVLVTAVWSGVEVEERAQDNGQRRVDDAQNKGRTMPEGQASAAGQTPSVQHQLLCILTTERKVRPSQRHGWLYDEQRRSEPVDGTPSLP